MWMERWLILAGQRFECAHGKAADEEEWSGISTQVCLLVFRFIRGCKGGGRGIGTFGGETRLKKTKMIMQGKPRAEKDYRISLGNTRGGGTQTGMML